jgi:hypothetical protein
MLRSVEDKDFAQARVEGLVGGRAKIEWLAQKDPGRMGSIEGFPTTVVGFSSDIPYMPAVGKPYLYGAGSILDAHTAREHIRRDDLALAVDDYVRIAKTLLD